MKFNFKTNSFGMNAVFFGTITLVAFNNCGQKLSSDAGLITMSSLSESDDGTRTFAQQASAPSNGQRAGESLADTLSQVKLYTSHSPNGPFVENGSVCKGKASYFKTTGVNPNMNVKGCASPSASQDCWQLAKNRDFQTHEWVSGNIVTTISQSESIDYPAGSYSFFIAASNGTTSIVQKVGVVNLENCAGVTPVAKYCQFRLLRPEAVIGGGLNRYPFVCNEQSVNRSGVVHYDAGASSKDFDAICECK